MTTYKQPYDVATKGNLPPVGDETQKAVVLQIDPKSEDKRLYVGGLAYCAVIDGQHWILGCDESMFFVHTSLFFKKKNADTGKWEDQPNVEKAVRSSYEANDCAYALCVDGHAGGEALVKALDGRFIDSDFYIETEDADKITTVAKAILNDEAAEIGGVISATFIVHDAESFANQKTRRGGIVPHPRLVDGKPAIIAYLPKVKSGKSSWGGGKAGFLATADRVKEVLAFKGDETFNSLFAWYCEEPAKVSFALALTGVTVNVPTATVTPTATPAVVAVVGDNPEAVANFKLVMSKEGNGEMDDYSSDAIKALATPDANDTYKEALLSLSDFMVNGKAFPFGSTKQKLGVTGTIFKFSLDDLKALQIKANELAA